MTTDKARAERTRRQWALLDPATRAARTANARKAALARHAALSPEERELDRHARAIRKNFHLRLRQE